MMKAQRAGWFLTGVASIGVAAAAESPPNVATIEEITVTARRVSESLQTVPIAVTAFSEAALERQQITNVRALDTAIPNIVFVPNTGQASAATIFLRGVGEDESFFTADPPVGIYIDDVYIPRQTGALFDLYDVERMEVLRGPQGTLYGRNTSAGAVKLVSRKPGETFGVNAEVRLGSYDRLDFRGALSGPLAETLSGQLAFLSRRSDGYTRNLTTGGRVNDQDLVGARASLLWKPTEKFEVLTVVDGTRERSGPGYAVAIVNNVYPATLAQVTDWHTTTSDLLAPQQDVDQNGISINAAFTIGESTLRSITAWRSLNQDLFIDADGRVGNPAGIGGSPGNVAFHLAQKQDQSQISEELQLAGQLFGERADYVVGLYWFRERNHQYTANVALVPANSPPFARNHTYVTLQTDSIAAFVNGKYRFTGSLSLSAGLRYTRDSKDFFIQALNASGAVRLTTTGVLAQRAIDQSWSDTTPRVSLDWEAAGDGWTTLTYLSASKGFKSGSYDGREGNPDFIVSGLQPIDPETVWSYELGLKGDWLDNRLRTNLAAFYNDYKDMQFGITKPDGSGFTRLNAGDATIKGLEVEIIAVPAEGLELFANLGLLDGEYSRFRDPGACFLPSEAVARDLLQLKKAPKTSWRVGGNYSWAFLGGKVTLGGDYSKKSRYFNNLCNSPQIATENYENLNAQLAYETADGRWRVTAAGTNLTDKIYWQGGFDLSATLGDAVYVVPPRMWSMAVRYSFQ